MSDNLKLNSEQLPAAETEIVSPVPFQFGLNNNVRSQKWEVFDGHHDQFETIFLQLDIILEIMAIPIYSIFWDPLQTRRPNIIMFQRPNPFNPTWNG